MKTLRLLAAALSVGALFLSLTACDDDNTHIGILKKLSSLTWESTSKVS